jgi:hypothetical protein
MSFSVHNIFVHMANPGYHTSIYVKYVFPNIVS